MLHCLSGGSSEEDEEKLEEPGQNSGPTIIGYSRIAASPEDIVKEARSSFLSNPSPIIGNACQ